MTHESKTNDDGRILDAQRSCDLLAIKDLVIAYAYAVDDRDWVRWQSLFIPEARIDYTSAGGIAGTPKEVAAWMPDAMAVFSFCMHSVLTHEIRFLAEDRAQGRAHVFNRNGIEWNGQSELVDVGAIYCDTYVRGNGAWRFASRRERTTYITGGSFADMIRKAAKAAAGDGAYPFG